MLPAFRRSRPLRWVGLGLGLLLCVGIWRFTVVSIRPSFERKCRWYLPASTRPVLPMTVPRAARPVLRMSNQLAWAGHPLPFRATPPSAPVCVFFEAAPAPPIGEVTTLQLAAISQTDDPAAHLTWTLPNSVTPMVNLSNGWVVVQNNDMQTTNYTQLLSLHANTVYRFRLSIHGVRAATGMVFASLAIGDAVSGGGNADHAPLLRSSREP